MLKTLYIKAKSENYILIESSQDILEIVDLLSESEQNNLNIAYENAFLRTDYELETTSSGNSRYILSKENMINIYLEDLEVIHEITSLQPDKQKAEQDIEEARFLLNTITSSLEDHSNSIGFAEKKYNVKITGYHLAKVYKDI